MNMQQEHMLRDQLKSQGTMYLPEDFQDVRKEDGANQSLIKTGKSDTANKKKKSQI